jgi:hypothetical protein
MATHVSSGQASVRHSGLQPVETSASFLKSPIQRPPSPQEYEAATTNLAPAVMLEIIKYEGLIVSWYMRGGLSPMTLMGLHCEAFGL